MTIHLTEDQARVVNQARAVSQAHKSGGAFAVARADDPEFTGDSTLAYPSAYGAVAWQLGSLLAVIDAHAEPEAEAGS